MNASLIVATNNNSVITSPAPLPGDWVVAKNSPDPLIKEDSVGVLDGIIGILKEEYLLTFNPTTPFRDRGYVSTGGGPAFYIPVHKLKYIGPILKTYWKWKNNIAGAGRNEDYQLAANLFEIDLQT